MKIIAGLGNPGREYEKTRHNLGFMVVDELARRAAAGAAKSRFKADLIDIVIGGEKIIMVKPMTYMNLSGHAVREVAAWYKVPRQDVLVVIDELDIPYGAIRMRANGSAGGHNGLRSVTEQLGGTDIPRLRIGIGRGRGVATTQVLSRFTPEEERDLPDIIAAAADCATAWATSGIVDAMNRCNRMVLEPPAQPPEPAAS
jgi:peptidyl-tRNA hydrolase, PTH1 family